MRQAILNRAMPPVVEHPEFSVNGNPSSSGRTIILGDIHGCDVALQTLLDSFEPAPDDVLVVLGDAVDRGPGSRQVLDHLCRMQQFCQVVYILGNHEEMLLQVLAGGRPKDWLRHGGAATINSYGGSLTHMPEAHRDLLASTVNYWESSKAICVHANLEPGVELSDQRPVWLRWQTLTGFEFPHPGGKMIVCGHTGQPTGLPDVRNGWICLDTLAHTGRYLTGLDLDSQVFFQATQSGKSRKFHLDEL